MGVFKLLDLQHSCCVSTKSSNLSEKQQGESSALKRMWDFCQQLTGSVQYSQIRDDLCTRGHPPAQKEPKWMWVIYNRKHLATYNMNQLSQHIPIRNKSWHTSSPTCLSWVLQWQKAAHKPKHALRQCTLTARQSVRSKYYATKPLYTLRLLLHPWTINANPCIFMRSSLTFSPPLFPLACFSFKWGNQSFKYLSSNRSLLCFLVLEVFAY